MRRSRRNPQQLFVGACIYILPFESLLRTEQYLHIGGKGMSLGNFIAWLCRQEEVYAYMLSSYVWDIGTPKGYEELQKQFTS